MSFPEKLASYLSIILGSGLNQKKLELIRVNLINAGLFDQDYYLNKYPDVHESGMSRKQLFNN